MHYPMLAWREGDKLGPIIADTSSGSCIKNIGLLEGGIWLGRKEMDGGY